MTDPNQTIPTGRQLTADEWKTERRQRIEREATYARLAAHLRRLDAENEISDAIDNAVAPYATSIPASADDFKRSVEAHYLKAAR